MSDQGTPGLADPGRALVALAGQLNAQVQVIPGPSSITAAISVCPFDCFAFHYLGFLPQDPHARVNALKGAATLTRPLVIMDTPYRLKHILGSCQQVFGKSRRGFVALDITGEQEDFWVGSFSDLVSKAEALSDKLNFVLIVDAPGAVKGRGRGRGRELLTKCRDGGGQSGADLVTCERCGLCPRPASKVGLGPHSPAPPVDRLCRRGGTGECEGALWAKTPVPLNQSKHPRG